MESATPQTKQPRMYTNKQGLQESRPNYDQGTIATETAGTRKTTSTDAKPGIDGTPANIHCTWNNKAPRPSTATFNYFEEYLAHEMDLTIHKLQLTTLHHLGEISERKMLDAFLTISEYPNPILPGKIGQFNLATNGRKCNQKKIHKSAR